MSQDFWEKVILLLATALVTGFAGPWVLKIIDARRADEQKRLDDVRAKNQKRFEAELARQGKVIEAQVKLIEDLSRFLWEFQLSLINVSYYKLMNPDMYEIALKNYEDGAGNRLGNIRAEISKSIRLVPEELYKELKLLYYDELLGLDSNLSVLARGDQEKSKRSDWASFNKYAVYNLSEKVDKIIDRLAVDLRLKAIPGDETQ